LDTVYHFVLPLFVQHRHFAASMHSGFASTLLAGRNSACALVAFSSAMLCTKT
jgi:hypothetical protein